MQTTSTIDSVIGGPWASRACALHAGSLHLGIEVPLIPDMADFAPPRIRRRRLAILIADVAGFSRLVERDPLATALGLRDLRRRLILPTLHAHRGRIVSVAGDGTLMAFGRAADAVNCAVAVQRALNATPPETAAGAPRLRLHMGISAGDSLAMDGDLYGHALNVAARLQALAEPGDVYLSDDVVAEVGDTTGIRFEALGRRGLRNIAQPVWVYRVARSALSG
jgi:adenylate cyclase